MAKNSADIIEFLVRIDKSDLDTLAQIRHFENLKLAQNENDIWVKGFSMEQIDGVAVKTLPKKNIFYIKDSSPQQISRFASVVMVQAFSSMGHFENQKVIKTGIPSDIHFLKIKLYPDEAFSILIIIIFDGDSNCVHPGSEFERCR